MSKSVLGKTLRDLRLRRGLTQQELADIASVSLAGIRDVEQGRVTCPRVSTLRRLSIAMDLSRADADQLLEIRVRGNQPSGDRLSVLGAIALVRDGCPVDLGSEEQRTLLGMLALRPNVPVSTDVLIDAVWGPSPRREMASLIQSRISRLRRRLRHDTQIGGIDIVADRGSYALVATTEQHDVLKYRAMIAQAQRSRDSGAFAAACASFSEAFTLWRGEPASDLPRLQSHPSVVLLSTERQATVVEYAQIAIEIGLSSTVLPLLRHTAALDPLHECVHAQLMLALAGCGEQGAALKVFHALRDRLTEDLGLDPGPAVRDAHIRVLRQEVTESTGKLGTAYRQLPPDVIDFSGRRRELATVLKRLPGPGRTPSAVPVVCVEGMGGVGKTRFAVHSAHRLVASGRYVDIQLYADLHGDRAQPTDPFETLGHFLRLLGVPVFHVPYDLDSRVALYRDRLLGKDALVLLDNVAAPEQVLPLIPACPQNLVMTTSRRHLAIDGSATVVLNTLSVEDSRALLATLLGSKCVKQDRNATERVIDLCGNLPAVLAMVAHQLRTRSGWTVSDMAEQMTRAGGLSGWPWGARALRKIFDPSYEALDPGEQRLFRLLGSHRAREFDAGLAAGLAGAPEVEVHQMLGRLVDERLLATSAHGRYRLLGLLSEFAGVRAAAESSRPDLQPVTELRDVS